MDKRDALGNLHFIGRLLILGGIIALISIIVNSWLGRTEGNVDIVFDLIFGVVMIYMGYTIIFSAKCIK